MKKTNILVKTVLVSTMTALFATAFTACENLQGSLSSSMQAELNEQTGTASYDYKTWYYNGYSGEDMTSVGAQTLCVNFGQKVYLKSVNPSGKFVITYTDSDGDTATKSITSLGGGFSPDCTSYYLDMSPITRLLDGVTTSATVDIKMSGFYCAEGEQTDRPIAAFVLSALQVRPLFTATKFDFSTVDFSTSSSFEIPFTGSLTLNEEGSSVIGSDSSGKDYEFSVSVKDKSLVLNPKFSEAPADKTLIKAELKGICAEGAGEPYKKTMTLNFIKHLIAIDGLEDANWTSSYTLSIADESGDTAAEGADGNIYTTDCDITKLAVTNDEDNLYLGIWGSLNSTWSDGFAFMISKDHSSDIAYATGKEKFNFADSVTFGRESLAHGKPDFYMYHKPQSNEVGAWVESDTTTAAAVTVDAAANSSSSFMEYAIPMTELAKAGIVIGDEVHVAAIFSAHWDTGIFASDVIPDAVASTLSENHGSIVLNFQNGFSYTVK